MTAYWIGVASAEHVRRGRAEGFMQLGHGKEAPLRRLRPGDGIVYYSPDDHLRREGRVAVLHRDRHRGGSWSVSRRDGR